MPAPTIHTRFLLGRDGRKFTAVRNTRRGQVTVATYARQFEAAGKCSQLRARLEARYRSFVTAAKSTRNKQEAVLKTAEEVGSIVCRRCAQAVALPHSDYCYDCQTPNVPPSWRDDKTEVDKFEDAQEDADYRHTQNPANDKVKEDNVSHRYIVAKTTSDDKPFGIFDRDGQRFVASYADPADVRDALETFYGWTAWQAREIDFDRIVATDKPIEGIRERYALDNLRGTLNRIRYSTSPYARGFRVGARAVLDTDAPPPLVRQTETRAEYRRGVTDGREAYAAAYPDKPTTSITVEWFDRSTGAWGSLGSHRTRNAAVARIAACRAADSNPQRYRIVTATTEEV